MNEFTASLLMIIPVLVAILLMLSVVGVLMSPTVVGFRSTMQFLKHHTKLERVFGMDLNQLAERRHQEDGRRTQRTDRRSQRTDRRHPMAV